MPWIPPSPGESYVRGPAYWPLRAAEMFGADPLAWLARWESVGPGERAIIMGYVLVRDWETARQAR